MKKTNYQFHFIITETIKCHINYLKKELKFKKEIELYEFMLKIISKNMTKLKGIIGDHKSEYALIDSIDKTRISKYARLKDKNYKLLKNWHSNFNEYGMSSIMRDIIKLFYEGIVKYGVEKFIEMISGKIDFERIWKDIKNVLTQMMRISQKKAVLFSFIAQSLSLYT